MSLADNPSTEPVGRDPGGSSSAGGGAVIDPKLQAAIDYAMERWGGALQKMAEWPEDELFGPAQSCPECDSPTRPRGASGIECTKCKWWWCT